jgi:hypothetical protein
MATTHQLELLNDALQAHLYAEAKVENGDLSRDAVVAHIRAVNVLFDRAVDCGMPIGEPLDGLLGETSVEGWAAERIASWLVSA